MVSEDGEWWMKESNGTAVLYTVGSHAILGATSPRQSQKVRYSRPAARNPRTRSLQYGLVMVRFVNFSPFWKFLCPWLFSATLIQNNGSAALCLFVKTRMTDRQTDTDRQTEWRTDRHTRPFYMCKLAFVAALRCGQTAMTLIQLIKLVAKCGA